MLPKQNARTDPASTQVALSIPCAGRVLVPTKEPVVLSETRLAERSEHTLRGGRAVLLPSVQCSSVCPKSIQAILHTSLSIQSLLLRLSQVPFSRRLCLRNGRRSCCQTRIGYLQFEFSITIPNRICPCAWYGERSSDMSSC